MMYLYRRTLCALVHAYVFVGVFVACACCTHAHDVLVHSHIWLKCVTLRGARGGVSRWRGGAGIPGAAALEPLEL